MCVLIFTPFNNKPGACSICCCERLLYACVWYIQLESLFVYTHINTHLKRNTYCTSVYMHVILYWVGYYWYTCVMLAICLYWDGLCHRIEEYLCGIWIIKGFEFCFKNCFTNLSILDGTILHRTLNANNTTIKDQTSVRSFLERSSQMAQTMNDTKIDGMHF
jgi:hypothetical protein